MNPCVGCRSKPCVCDSSWFDRYLEWCMSHEIAGSIVFIVTSVVSTVGSFALLLWLISLAFDALK
jgi:hypothetical protein